jgi:carbamoylphosphate synthase large subunit
MEKKMERPAKRLNDALKEVRDFFRGEGCPLICWVPDGQGGTEKRIVANVEEYAALSASLIAPTAKGASDAQP